MKAGASVTGAKLVDSDDRAPGGTAAQPIGAVR